MCVRRNAPSRSKWRPSGSACEVEHGGGSLLSGLHLGGQGGVGVIGMASGGAVLRGEQAAQRFEDYGRSIGVSEPFP